MNEEAGFDDGPFAVEIGDSAKTGGALFEGWAVFRTVWFGNGRPASTKDKVFLVDAVMEAGRRQFADWGDADLKTGGERLPEIANWLLGCIRKGSIKAFGLADGGDRFQETEDALWLDWQAYPKFFWCCQIPATADGNDALLIYLDRRGFNHSLGVKLRQTPRAHRGRNLENAVEFFEEAFVSDPNRTQRKEILTQSARVKFPNLGPAGLGRAWRLAVEKYPERKRAGRPRSPKNGPEIG